MEPRMSIDFENAEGEIRRILGVIEQRGFEIRSIALPDSDGEARITVGLKPRGQGRSLDVLGRQIARLHNVKGVQVPQGQ